MTMTPCNDAVCYVNGSLVTETVTLKTGSRVIFGRSHVFRFMQPNQGILTPVILDRCAGVLILLT